MSESAHTEPRRLEIRKYPNRRYYDTTRSRHLTMDDIHALVREGCDIQVTDSKTSRDITAQVLTQIILELETKKLDSFPVPLLARVIRVNDQLVKDFIEKYFNQALNSFLGYQHQLEEQLRQAHGLPVVYPTVSAWTKAMLHPFNAAFGTETTNDPKAPATSETAEHLRQMVNELQQEVALLKQRRVQKPGKHTAKKKPRS